MALSSGKKFCLWMIILGTLALIAGSAAPYWLTLDTLVAKGTYGLWFFCAEALGSTTCETYKWADYDLGDYSAWFYAVHGAAGLATLISIILLFVSLGKVCGDSDATTNVGVFTLIAGLLGIGAAVVFYLKEATSFALVYADLDRDWAFIVFSSGTCVMAFFSIVLLALPNTSTSTVRPY